MLVSLDSFIPDFAIIAIIIASKAKI